MEQKKAEEQKNLEICEEEQKQTEESEEGITLPGQERGVERFRRLFERLGPIPDWYE